MTKQFISKAEAKSLVLGALADGRKATKARLIALCEHYEFVKLWHSLYQAVIDGEVGIDVSASDDPESWTFKARNGGE